jgi:hypothetical protein
MSVSTIQQRLTVGQFFSGLFAALAEQGRHQVYRSGAEFDRALSAAFQKFTPKAAQANVKPAFLIVLHRLYGDSEVIEQGLSAALLRDLISRYNPSFEKFQLNLNPIQAREILEDLPGGPDVYRHLADDFFAEYQEQSHHIHS